MQLSAPDILTFLLIAAAVLLIIVLYHILFLVVDLRKITARINAITQEVENMIMKPLSLMEESMTWLTDFLIGMYGNDDDHPKKHKKKK